MPEVSLLNHHSAFFWRVSPLLSLQMVCSKKAFSKSDAEGMRTRNEPTPAVSTSGVKDVAVLSIVSRMRGTLGVIAPRTSSPNSRVAVIRAGNKSGYSASPQPKCCLVLSA